MIFNMGQYRILRQKIGVDGHYLIGSNSGGHKYPRLLCPVALFTDRKCTFERVFADASKDFI